MRMFLAVVATGLVLAGARSASGEAEFVVHAGEWRNSVEQATGQPPTITLVCKRSDQTMTAATMSAMMSRMSVHCATPTMSDDGTNISLAITCDIGGGKLTTNSLVTRDGPDAITSHSTSHMVGGSFKMQDMNIVSHARRMGPCQPGDKPEPDFEPGAGH